MIGKGNQIRGTFSDKWNLLRNCGGIISTKIIFQGTLLNQVFQIHRFKQIYLFFSRNFFNWTWTYRSDSDLTKGGGPRGFIVKDLDQPKPPG